MLKSNGLPFSNTFLKNLESQAILLDEDAKTLKKNKKRKLSNNSSTNSWNTQKNGSEQSHIAINESIHIDIESKAFTSGKISHDSTISAMKTQLSSRKSFTALESNESPLRRLLIIQESSGCLYASGFLSIQTICGKISANGYVLKSLSEFSLRAPVWCPAIRLFYKSSSKISLKCRDLMSEFQIPKNFFDDPCTIILVIGQRWCDLEWIEASENFSPYLNTDNLPIESCYCSVGSGIVCDIDSIRALQLKHINIPQSWVNTSEALVTQYQNNKQLKIAICGAKGSGKSTMLKFLINRFLNYCPGVCVMDCDLGQPEFTIPGMISLSHITSPILQPTHMNMNVKPILSYYLGEITSKTCPDIFFDAIGKLNESYLMVQSNSMQYLQSSPQNQFDYLKDASNRIPLLINCDGNIRNFGEECLNQIISILEPTHTVYLETPKGTSNIPRSIERMSTSNSTFYKVESGYLSPSNINAADLRILRIVSYFLRFSTMIRDFVINPDSVGDENKGIAINSGAVSDPEGILALALASLPCLKCSMDRTRFQSLNNHNLPAKLILASFNASLVGITTHESEESLLRSTVSFHRLRQSSSNTEFAISLRNRKELIPCQAVGILRAIDIEEQSILIIAQPDILAANDQYTNISKGSLAPPLSLVYSNLLPSLPYLTGESFGEGSTMLKTRSNLKRKSQHADTRG